MKSTKLLSSTCIAMVLMTLATTAIAQTQAIHTLKMTDGTENRAYNTDALIDMQSTSRGLLLPRVELTSTTATAPLAAHTAGMVVYNTVTVNDVTPGYYYDDGSKWVRIGASSGSGWALTGNTGITANSAAYGTSLTAGTGNWLGTINSADLILAANNKEGLRVNNSQQVLIGTTTVPTGGTTAKVIIDNGTTAGALQIKDGTQGAGKVLTSDANGVATWGSPGQFEISPIGTALPVNGSAWGPSPSSGIVIHRGTMKVAGNYINTEVSLDGGVSWGGWWGLTCYGVETAPSSTIMIPKGAYVRTSNGGVLGAQMTFYPIN